MAELFDLIVVGCGGVGSATAYYAAARGMRVLALEQHESVHALGSSHGETRVIRQAYFEHPDYVPLLKRAYQLWYDLETTTHQQLFYRTGLLEIGPETGSLVQGVRSAAALHHLPLETVDRSSFSERFPGFNLPEESVALFESNAGFLLVEECIRTYIQAARNQGADLRFHVPVRSWNVEDGLVRVQTDQEQFVAPRLVIAAGAWASTLLAEIGLRLRVLRKHLHWYATRASHDYSIDGGSPTFFYEVPEGYFYGFPSRDRQSLKVAQHSGGEAVLNPATVDRTVDAHERGEVEQFLARNLPNVTRTSTAHAVCMYTMSPMNTSSSIAIHGTLKSFSQLG